MLREGPRVPAHAVRDRRLVARRRVPDEDARLPDAAAARVAVGRRAAALDRRARARPSSRRRAGVAGAPATRAVRRAGTARTSPCSPRPPWPSSSRTAGGRRPEVSACGLPAARAGMASALEEPNGADAVVELRVAEEFDVFYRREMPALVAFARSLSGSASADDIAQDAMLAAYRRWDTVSRMDVPVAWVRRVCANRAISTLRRRAVEVRGLHRLLLQREPGEPLAGRARGVLVPGTTAAATAGAGHRPALRLRPRCRRDRADPRLRRGDRQVPSVPRRAALAERLSRATEGGSMSIESLGRESAAARPGARLPRRSTPR